jgi:hypothetical protein
MCGCNSALTPQWGGVSLPTDPMERARYVSALLKGYTQLQIDEDPILKYLQVHG